MTKGSLYSIAIDNGWLYNIAEHIYHSMGPMAVENALYSDGIFVKTCKQNISKRVDYYCKAIPQQVQHLCLLVRPKIQELFFVNKYKPLSNKLLPRAFDFRCV